MPTFTQLYGGPPPTAKTYTQLYGGPPTAATASGGGYSGGYGGYDPGVLAAQAGLTSGNYQIDANLKADRQRAIIDFGDPELASLAGFDLDPEAAAQARANYGAGNAVLARLDRQKKLARQAIINRLAGRGILQSGDLGYLEGQEDVLYGNNLYDARQHLLDYLTNLGRNAQDRRGALQSALQQAQLNAYYNGITGGDYYDTSGGGGASGGPSGGGGPADMNDFLYGSTIPAGYSANDLYGAAASGAPQGAIPMHVMNQGMVQNGMIYVKYWMPDSTTNSIWVPLGSPASGGSAGGQSASPGPLSGRDFLARLLRGGS